MKASSRSSAIAAGPQLAGAIPLILLCVAAFLAPMIGGGIPTEAEPVQPGYAPTVRALFNGVDLPLLSHFVLALLVGVAGAWVLASRRVLQVPMVWLLAPLLGVFGLAVASVVFSAFPFLSLAGGLEWLVYAVAFAAAVAVVGRRRGPIAALASLFGGCLLQSLLGIWQYVALTNDPTWRIFGTWQNPNALAGMLLLGFFSGIGLAMRARHSLHIAGAIAGTSLIGLALALTQSKGALLAAGLGCAAVFVLSISWLTGKRGVALGLLGRVAATLVVLIGLLLLIRLSHSTPASGGVLSRVTQAQSTQDQSAGFRTLLWRSSAQLIRQKPLGWGMGSFRFESARPGLTTQTHLAHNSFLQLGVEAGLLAPILLLAAGAVWLAFAFKGARRQEPDALALKIGVVAAIVAGAAHSLVDSDLHYFGSGLAFFLLLGIGLQLNVDGGSPESLPAGPRWSAFAAAVAAPLGLLYFGIVEASKCHIRWHLVRSEPGEARAGAEELLGAASGDGEAWYLRAIVEPDPTQRLRYLKGAVDRMPTTRNYRMLARAQEEDKDITAAAGTLNLALQRDPNNLPALKLLLDLHLNAKNDAMAAAVAERLVVVEDSPYFRIRALPEMVPTETYFARRYLSLSAQTPDRKIELLKPAFDGLLEYAARTAPNVAAATKEGLPRGFAGETAEDARAKIGLGQDVARELATAYRTKGDALKASEVEKGSAQFVAALAAFG